jgi:hypothetical protein
LLIENLIFGMPKIIVTHANPDLDAIGAVWLLKRFDPDYQEARVAFVPAGSTYQDKPVDSSPDVVHVDTGLGRFDHHQTNKRTSAAQLVLEHLLTQKPGQLESPQALKRLIALIVEDDHFEDCYWPEADHDRYTFFITAILDGVKSGSQVTDDELAVFGMRCLDGVYATLKLRVEAEQEMKEKGKEFISPWGKALAIAGQNKEIEKLAQKRGYVLVIRKDPEAGNVRIKAQPKSDVDLSVAYEQLRKKDPQATWFLHVSKRMLLNGTHKDPTMKSTTLSLEEVVALLKGKS